MFFLKIIFLTVNYPGNNIPWLTRSLTYDQVYPAGRTPHFQKVRLADVLTTHQNPDEIHQKSYYTLLSQSPVP